MALSYGRPAASDSGARERSSFNSNAYNPLSASRPPTSGFRRAHPQAPGFNRSLGQQRADRTFNSTRPLNRVRTGGQQAGSQPPVRARARGIPFASPPPAPRPETFPQPLPPPETFLTLESFGLPPASRGPIPLAARGGGRNS